MFYKDVFCVLHLNTSVWEGIRKFHQTFNGVHGTKQDKNPCSIISQDARRVVGQCNGNFMGSFLMVAKFCARIQERI